MHAINSILWIAGIALLNGCAPAPLTLKISVNDIYCTDNTAIVTKRLFIPLLL
jgi:hypothetical protein